MKPVDVRDVQTEGEVKRAWYIEGSPSSRNRRDADGADANGNIPCLPLVTER